MTETEKKKAAEEFSKRWFDKGYEKGESQQFWIDLLEHVYGIKNTVGYISFEDQVKIDHTSFIDGYIETAKVMIEQKSIDKDLDKKIKQSDGTKITPFQQAKRYISELPLSKHPKWVITCNFKEFRIYDMENPTEEPISVELSNLRNEYHKMNFLVDGRMEKIIREEELSIKAGVIVGKLYDALLNQYDKADRKNPQILKDLNKLCVRIVFCLYAEDTTIFTNEHLSFHNYLVNLPAVKIRTALKELFKVLDTPYGERDKYLESELQKFPYVSGGLFKGEIEIPPITESIKHLLIVEASERFDWSGISPTIFGTVFESTLNPDTRHEGGMHYTSVENIHKVIDPLFLDDLNSEYNKILNKKQHNERKKALVDFQNKLAKIKILDPACGSGNFLTESYRSLRRLENKVIQELYGEGLMVLNGLENDVVPIKVSISQFYGIEINDLAVTVSMTALWIAEHQMISETQDIIKRDIAYLPLKNNNNIVEANALRIDWESVVSKSELSYIIGNPPFLYVKEQSQKDDMKSVLRGFNNVGEMDYVCCWYKKSFDYIQETNIECAFVSTNSICQGQQVATFWKPLITQGININFAYQTFVWSSETTSVAHVHCVIIGFSLVNKDKKVIYSKDNATIVDNITPYLTNTPMVFIGNRNNPICDVPKMHFGNMPRDGGGFILSDDDVLYLQNNDPSAMKWVHEYIGGTEFIRKNPRHCLWLVDATPKDINSSRFIKDRIAIVKEMRKNSTAVETQRMANTPTLFAQITQPVGQDYIIIPSTSSSQRKYIPIGFINGDVIASNAAQIIPNATLYHFGILTSSVHMAWMRTVGGRLKSDYRYSKDIVYNNFIWCSPTKKQKSDIEQTAQAILDARALYPDCTYADLYDELTMPPELRKAHNDNDKAVMKAYGFKPDMSESEIVSELFKLYLEYTTEQ